MNRLNLIWIYPLLLFSLSLHAQQRIPLDSVCRILSDSFPHESVYLHMDKDRYMAGDTVWFKAYLSSGVFPSAIGSTGLRIALINGVGTVVQQKYYPVLHGKISLGDIELKDSLPQGLYTIRAYTDYMGNFDPETFFHYTFPVYGVSSAQGKKSGPARVGAADGQGAPVSAKAGAGSTSAGSTETGSTGGSSTGGGSTGGGGAGDFDIQFLPEGGSAVQNVMTNVAFRATDFRGIPMSIKGKVVDDQDTLAATFTTLHDGMGSFQYIPWKGRTYTAIVETPQGQKRISLPDPEPDGVVLNTKTTDNGVGFVLRADTVSKYLNQKLTVLGTMYGQLVYHAKTSLTSETNEIGGFIPTKDFVTGILTITVLDSSGTPLAERVSFIRPTDVRLGADLSTDTLNLSTKGFNAWNLHIKDSVRAYLSVSVTDADAYVPLDNGPSILSGVLLGGELKGQVYHPAWYFRGSADSTSPALDLVMLTHGWRRYDWKALQEQHFPQLKYNGKNYLTFDGQALTENGKKVVGNTLLILFLKLNDSTKTPLFTPLDSQGHFSINQLVFFDTAQAYFQVNKKGYKGTNVQLRLTPPPYFPLNPQDLKGVVFPEPATDTAFIGSGNKEADLLAGLRRLQKAKELKEIIIKGHKKTPLEEMDERYASGLFTGGYSRDFDVLNDKAAMGYMDIITYLQGRVAGVIISGAYPNVSVRYRGGTPAFFLDEVPTTLDALETVPVPDIAYVKVFEPPFVGAFGGGPYGAIAVYTRRGGDISANDPGLNRLTLAGYNNFRQCYAPVYTPKDLGPGGTPDYRITLDWLPYLFAGPGVDQLPIRFYNNDAAQHIRIVAEGFDESGKLLHFEKVIEAPGAAKNP
jgi:hypothetical protein